MTKKIPELQNIDGITYQLNSDIPYTGSFAMIFDNGDKSEGSYVNGKEHGLWSYLYDDCKLYESNVKNGMYHGLETWWHNKDLISIEGRYYNNQKTGVWRSWHANGHISSEGMYKNGERHGLWTYWHSQKTFPFVFTSQVEEQIQKTIHFVDGVKNGAYVEWYSSGNKMLETNFKSGFKDGLYTEWNEAGQKRLEGKYIANLEKNRQHKTGVWSTWSQYRGLIAKEAWREGILIGELV